MRSVVVGQSLAPGQSGEGAQCPGLAVDLLRVHRLENVEILVAGVGADAEVGQVVLGWSDLGRVHVVFGRLHDGSIALDLALELADHLGLLQFCLLVVAGGARANGLGVAGVHRVRARLCSRFARGFRAVGLASVDRLLGALGRRTAWSNCFADAVVAERARRCGDLIVPVGDRQILAGSRHVVAGSRTERHVAVVVRRSSSNHQPFVLLSP